jgi:cytoskeletal protein RodZ
MAPKKIKNKNKKEEEEEEKHRLKRKKEKKKKKKKVTHIILPICWPIIWFIICLWLIQTHFWPL